MPAAPRDLVPHVGPFSRRRLLTSAGAFGVLNLLTGPAEVAAPPVQAGRSLFVDDPMVSAAWTWGTVLSLPTVIGALVAQLSAVLT